MLRELGVERWQTGWFQDQGWGSITQDSGASALGRTLYIYQRLRFSSAEQGWPLDVFALGFVRAAIALRYCSSSDSRFSSDIFPLVTRPLIRLAVLSKGKRRFRPTIAVISLLLICVSPPSLALTMNVKLVKIARAAKGTRHPHLSYSALGLGGKLCCVKGAGISWRHR